VIDVNSHGATLLNDCVKSVVVNDIPITERLHVHSSETLKHHVDSASVI
jgi:hypothetical protein